LSKTTQKHRHTSNTIKNKYPSPNRSQTPSSAPKPQKSAQFVKNKKNVNNYLTALNYYNIMTADKNKKQNQKRGKT
jgi:hypothetical protein